MCWWRRTIMYVWKCPACQCACGTDVMWIWRPWDGDSQTEASTMRSEGAEFSQLQTAFRITFVFLVILLKVTPHLQSAWKCLLSTQMRRINLQGASLFVCLFLFICSVRLMRACYRYLVEREMQLSFVSESPPKLPSLSLSLSLSLSPLSLSLSWHTQYHWSITSVIPARNWFIKYFILKNE